MPFDLPSEAETGFTANLNLDSIIEYHEEEDERRGWLFVLISHFTPYVAYAIVAHNMEIVWSPEITLTSLTEIGLLSSGSTSN